MADGGPLDTGIGSIVNRGLGMLFGKGGGGGKKGMAPSPDVQAPPIQTPPPAPKLQASDLGSGLLGRAAQGMEDTNKANQAALNL